MAYIPLVEEEKALCRELGLVPETVRSIRIHLLPHDVVTAEVEIMVPEGMAKRLFNSGYSGEVAPVIERKL